MNLIDYANILIRRGWIMLLLALIAAGSRLPLQPQRSTPSTAPPSKSASSPAAPISA